MKILFLVAGGSETERMSHYWRKNGHEVRTYNYRPTEINLNSYRLNKAKRILEKRYNIYRIKKEIKSLDPDVILTIKGEIIDPKTVAESSAYSVLWFPDDPFLFGMSRELEKGYDLVLTNSKTTVDDYRSKAIYFPFSSSKEEYYGERKKKYDVSFIGKHDLKRERYISSLPDNITKFVGGPGWNNVAGADYEDEWIDTKKMIKIYEESKVILNIAKTREHITKRVFEANRCSSAVLSERLVGLGNFYANNEVEVFKDKEQMVHKLMKLIGDKKYRKKISKKGKQKTSKKYSIKRISSKIENILSKNK